VPSSVAGVLLGSRSRRLPAAWPWGDESSAHGSSDVFTRVSLGFPTKPAVAASRFFPPAVAVHRVQLAGERADHLGRSLAPWDGVALARPLAREGLVEPIAPEPVRRILAHPTLQPGRHHRWRSPHTPRDAKFCARVAAVVERYTRRLPADEMGLGVEENTSWQPRPRRHATRPAQPGRPTQVEPESRRAGALKRWAAFATRPGQVDGPCDGRQRQRECIACLEALATARPARIKTIHRVCAKA